jgi:hypothetical protein
VQLPFLGLVFQTGIRLQTGRFCRRAGWRHNALARILERRKRDARRIQKVCESQVIMIADHLRAAIWLV